MEHHLTRFRNVVVKVEKEKKPVYVMIDKIHIQQVSSTS
jgi:hypothetical protein